MKDTRTMILKTAFDLFQKNGYENTTVTDICKAAGITKGTFYYHFPNKDELSFQYYENIFEDFFAALPNIITIPNTKEQLWKVTEFVIDRSNAIGSKVMYALYLADIENGMFQFSPYHPHDSDTGSSRYVKLMMDIVRKGQQTGQVRKGNAVTMVRTYIAALVGVVLAWSSNNEPFEQKNRNP